MRKIFRFKDDACVFLNDDYENAYDTVLKVNNSKGLQHVKNTQRVSYQDS